MQKPTEKPLKYMSRKAQLDFRVSKKKIKKVSKVMVREKLFSEAFLSKQHS